MYARVARWEGHTPDELRQIAQDINERAGSGPPEGVPAKGFMMLVDYENGRNLSVALFETEDDLRKGDEALNAMNPPGNPSGRRVGVEIYEVAVDLET